MSTSNHAHHYQHHRNSSTNSIANSTSNLLLSPLRPPTVADAAIISAAVPSREDGSAIDAYDLDMMFAASTTKINHEQGQMQEDINPDDLVLAEEGHGETSDAEDEPENIDEEDDDNVQQPMETASPIIIPRDKALHAFRSRAPGAREGMGFPGLTSSHFSDLETILQKSAAKDLAMSEALPVNAVACSFTTTPSFRSNEELQKKKQASKLVAKPSSSKTADVDERRRLLEQHQALLFQQQQAMRQQFEAAAALAKAAAAAVGTDAGSTGPGARAADTAQPMSPEGMFMPNPWFQFAAANAMMPGFPDTSSAMQANSGQMPFPNPFFSMPYFFMPGAAGVPGVPNGSVPNFAGFVPAAVPTTPRDSPSAGSFPFSTPTTESLTPAGAPSSSRMTPTTDRGRAVSFNNASANASRRRRRKDTLSPSSRINEAQSPKLQRTMGGTGPSSYQQLFPAKKPGDSRSRFCHICLRNSKSVKQLVCNNIHRGSCRKVVCQKCFEQYGWNWELASKDNREWLCPHCLGCCPPRASCNVYKKTNQTFRKKQAEFSLEDPAGSSPGISNQVLPVHNISEMPSLEDSLFFATKIGDEDDMDSFI